MKVHVERVHEENPHRILRKSQGFDFQAQARGFAARMRLLLLSMALFMCSTAWGEADIELSVSLIGGSFVPPGAEGGSVEIRWVNHGPDAATNVAAGTATFTGPGQSNLSIGPIEQTPPCSVSRFCFDSPPGGSTLCSNTIFSEPSILQPGEEAVCIIRLITSSDSPDFINQTFSAWRPDDDPNGSNNVVTLQVYTGNGLTPVPLGGTGAWLVLAFGVLVLGFKEISGKRVHVSKLRRTFTNSV